MVIWRVAKQTMSLLTELLANKNRSVLVPKFKRIQTTKQDHSDHSDQPVIQAATKRQRNSLKQTKSLRRTQNALLANASSLA